MNSFGVFHHTCKSRPHLATSQRYERPDAQVLDTLFDLFLSAEQCFGRDLQQLASVVSNLLHNAHLQIRRRLETGMLESASAVSATAVLDPSKDLKDRSWVWQMIVYQNQSRRLVSGIDRHRSGQLHGCLKGAWSDDRFGRNLLVTARAV